MHAAKHLDVTNPEELLLFHYKINPWDNNKNVIKY
jgi:hypothetical protein